MWLPFIVMSTSLLESLAYPGSNMDNSENCQDSITHFMGYYFLNGEAAAIRCPAFQYLQIDSSELSDHSLDLVWTKKYFESVTVESDSHLQPNKELLWFFPGVKEDTGVYTCILRNSSFCVEVAMTVNVLDRTEVSLAEIAYEQTAYEDSSSKVYCPDLGDFTDSYSNFQLKWFKDGEPLPEENQKYELLDGSTFITIKHVQKEDEGYYTCKFVFMHGEIEYTASRIISLHTVVPDKREHPVILQPSQNTLASSLGSTLTIPCKVFTGVGRNNPIVWWLANKTFIEEFFKDGRVFEGPLQETTEADGHYIELPLIFKVVKEEDFSTNFMCVASNDYGKEVLPTSIREAASPFSWYIAAVPAALICLIVAIIAIYKYKTSKHKTGYSLDKI
ncbi:interleukin-1 receptor type 2-like [Spea bombifrons]|uniref:interleukin-1 receptor type 2-like n=1 Tax=Spea bombifrons TaxID=233779 RepID=UPI00234AB3F3|nr:interleukin-1 receptor type 2-like [Spea bombifrons]